MAHQQGRIETYQYVDALSKAIDILGPQLGSDQIDLSELRINQMRMTRLNKVEMLSIMYFRDKDEITGHHKSWYSRKMDEYMDLKMSEEGHERPILIVKALQAIGGSRDATKPKKDERSFVQKHLTRRNKGPEAEE